TGKDCDFGAGRIDAFAAVNYVTGSGGPMIILRIVAVHDSPPGGNNDGRLDPGEQARLRITLRNSGGAACNNTVGTFRSGDSRVLVIDSLGTWGDIPSGGEATNTDDPIEVSASSLIPPGTRVSCTLFVTGDSAYYSTKIPILLTVGVPPPQPGTIIWGPKVCPGMPSDWGLYGVAYNSQDSLIYCVYFMSPTAYKYSSDSLLQARGTITLPEDSCTDIDYCSYDNTFWLVANPSKRVYKITPTGSVIRYFTVPQAEYPCGVVEHEESHILYLSDRRSSTTPQQRIFVYDTLGNILDTIIHPVSGVYGTRCLALDYRCPDNPPSILNIFTWFDATGTYLDSSGMLEIDRVNETLRNHFRFANTEWNIRGIECDPRDGSYWITIMQYASGSNNMIFKVVGFNMGSVGVEEGRVAELEIKGRIKVDARPNPFTGRTVLTVAMEQPGTIDLQVFDNTGRLVRNVARQRAVITGSDFIWDGRDDAGTAVARGVYFYRVKSSDCEAWGKVVLTR
ncbi:MAG: T9SS type A sorting domain-containing protein, partial [bacterium]